MRVIWRRLGKKHICSSNEDMKKCEYEWEVGLCGSPIVDDILYIFINTNNTWYRDKYLWNNGWMDNIMNTRPGKN